MELMPFVAVQRATLGKSELRQQDARVLDDGPTVVLASALGPPRLWSYLLDTTLRGFGDGFARPHDGRANTRIHQGLRVAQQALRARVDELIEKRASDVELLALSLEGSVLHVLSAGSMRTYLYRHRTLRRLGGRSDSGEILSDVRGRSEGLLKLSGGWCAEQVEPGDMLFASAAQNCGEERLSELQRALDHDRALSPDVVLTLLHREAVERGTAAASIAFRVPVF